MAGGYTTPDSDPLDGLFRELRDIERRIRELEMPTGTQTAQAVATLTQLVTDLAAEVNALAASGIDWEGPVNTTGRGDFDTGLASTGAAVLDLSTIAGPRQSAWQHIATGEYGYSPSTLAEKRNLRPVPFTAADILSIAPRVFHYRGQLDIRDNADNPAHDPTYEVPDEVGLIAEELLAHGLDLFVMVDDDGTPRGVHYELFGAVAALVIGADLDARVTANENRIDQLVAALNGS